MATKVPAKKSKAELQTNCEVAAEILAEYFAFCAKLLAAAKQESPTNNDKVRALQTQLDELHREKLALSLDNIELINKALYLYARILKNAEA
jgi:hypothetical protein